MVHSGKQDVFPAPNQALNERDCLPRALFPVCGQTRGAVTRPDQEGDSKARGVVEAAARISR